MKYFWNEDCENDEENNEDIKDMRNRELGNRRTKMSDQFKKITTVKEPSSYC